MLERLAEIEIKYTDLSEQVNDPDIIASQSEWRRLMKEYKLILASASPRRHQLLCEAGFKFEVKLKHIEEIWPQEMPAEQVPEYLAGLKAAAFTGELNPGELLITADTVVCLDNVILGKPRGREEAIDMLNRLSGRKHTVETGVCLTTVERQQSFSAYNDV